MPDRVSQPRCESCHHPISFHGGGRTRCKASGCVCGAYTGLTAEAVDTIGVEEVAKAVGKSQTFVKDHPRKFGGRKMPTRIIKGKRSAQKVWRFDPLVLSKSS